MLIKRLSQLVIAFLAIPFLSEAQVTTSNISGVVVTEKNEPLVGANVSITYEPSNYVYKVVSKKGGRFDVSNVPPGGPYSISVTFIGNGDFKKSDIFIPLGEKYDIKVEMSPSSTNLQNVVVIGGRKSVSEKTGASTNISRAQITNLPNISRAITGVTKLTPQSNGNSFAGMNNRYNNITIDGSLFNNNFGRGGEGFVPGGASSAISIDAIDQVQVNIAPFDVRQAGFVGGGVNAVTRRGTNNWYATAFIMNRGHELYGKKILNQTVDVSKLSAKTYGGSIGGPIIKNKLFFFVNAEGEKRTLPGQNWLAKRPGTNDGNPQLTPVLASDLDQLRTYVNNTYGFDPGIYEGYNFQTDNFKFLGRIDWVISNKHRFSARYSQSETNDDDMVNTSSGPTGATRLNNGRRGGTNGGLAFDGTNFKNNTKVISGVIELNSSISSKVSNQLIASYTDNQPKRVPNVSAPFVDIMKDASNVYISLGTDLFSYKNSIKDIAYNVSDNVTANLGKHVITGGVSYEYMTFENSFMSSGGPSYYRYASLQDFLDNKAPSFFNVTYDPANPTGINVPSAKFAQLGVYVQDVWSASDKFKLTYGVRVDKPFYPYTPPKNAALEAVVFKDEKGNDESFDVSKWPDAKLLVSPRVGFTYDVEGDKSLIIRGGTGLFTGRIPFIWLVNQVGDNGVVRASYTPTGSDLAAIRYNTDRTTYIPTNPPAVGTSIPSGSSYSAVAKDFKMPQVWKTNLAIDKKLSNTVTLTIEALYSKIRNNVYFRNANLGSQNGSLGNSLINKPYYNTKLNASINQMAVMDNINKGGSFSFSTSIQKSFSKGWEASIAYAYTYADEVAIGSSDQSGSGWTTNNITYNPNQPDLGYSNYSIPHRVVAALTKRFEYAHKNMATTIGLIYTGSSQERYTFRYGSDINGDGATNDVIYVPKDASEIVFVEGFKVGSKTYTAKQQSDAFFNFINNDKALSKNKGKYFDKYAGLLPWLNSLDARILQDFSLKVGGKKHTIQASADIINVLNLINKDWGYKYSYTFGTFSDMGILGTPSSSNNTGAEAFNRANPKFTFNPDGPTKAYQPNYSASSTWSVQLGLRYILN